MIGFSKWLDQTSETFIILLCVIFIIQVVNWPLGHLIYTELRWWSFIKSCLTLVLKDTNAVHWLVHRVGFCQTRCNTSIYYPDSDHLVDVLKSAEDTDLTFFILFTLGKLSVPSQFKMDAVFMMLCLWQNLQQLLIWTSHILTGSLQPSPPLPCKTVSHPFSGYHEAFLGLINYFR